LYEKMVANDSAIHHAAVEQTMPQGDDGERMGERAEEPKLWSMSDRLFSD